MEAFGTVARTVCSARDEGRLQPGRGIAEGDVQSDCASAVVVSFFLPLSVFKGRWLPPSFWAEDGGVSKKQPLAASWKLALHVSAVADCNLIFSLPDKQECMSYLQPFVHPKSDLLLTGRRFSSP